nr:carbohydrate kinase [Lachnospiraceae bacterium]
SEIYTDKIHVTAPGSGVKPVDTTGAGDAFIGSFLFQLLRDDVTPENVVDITEEQAAGYLKFSTKYSGISISKYGAIDSYATLDEMN